MDVQALGTAPIAGDEPQGQDARYEPEYIELSDEIAKLNSITQGGSINWERIAKKGEIILEKKSKDLQVATYVAFAWQQLRGAEGLSDGVDLLLLLLKTFWESAYPPLARIRRRTNAFEWWHERVHAALEKTDAQTEIPQALSTHLQESLRELDQTMGDLMSDAQPLRDLFDDVRRIPVASEPVPEVPEPSPEAAPQEASPPSPPKEESVPQSADPSSEKASPSSPPPPEAPKEKEKAPAAPPETPKSKAPQTPPPQPKESTASADPADLEGALTEFSGAAVRYALAAHAVSLADPLPWRLLRLGLWTRIRNLPPSDNGETHIPQPDTDRLEGFHKMLASKNFEPVALGCENLATAAPFWFDLHFLADKALEGLGSDYADARKSLREETGRFIRRLQGIEELTFDGGLPFADSDTKSWLQTLGESQMTVAVPVMQQGGSASPLQEILTKASEEASEGRIQQALILLEEACGNSPATRMPLRIKALEILCVAQETETAGLLARTLLNELDAFNIEQWDDALAVDALLAVRTAKTLLGDREGALSAQERIVRLSPSRALGWHL